MVGSYYWPYKLIHVEMSHHLLGVSDVLRLYVLRFVIMWVSKNNGDNDFVQMFDTRVTWAVKLCISISFLRLRIVLVCREEY